MDLFSFMPVAGFISGFISLLLIFLFIKKIKQKKKGTTGYIIHFLAIFVFGFLSSTLLLFYASFRNYKNFTYNKPIFSVSCPIKEDNWFVLQINPLDNGEKSEPRFYRLNGQQFVLEGHIVKWENFFVALGMKPLYQLTRLTGRYISIDEEKSKERSVYQIEEEPFVWSFLMRHGEKIPGIDAVYGASSFKGVEENKKFTVEITHNAFVIKEK